MAKVLAALNDSLATRPVLEAALGLGRLFAADVEAIHIGQEDGQTATLLAQAAGVPFRRVVGEVVPTILGALDAPNIAALAIGCRGSTMGRRPAGHVTLQILTRATKPVVVVPPQATRTWQHSLRRVVIPLDDTSESSAACGAFFAGCAAGVELDVTAIHVVDDANAPALLNEPGYDVAAWRRSFQQRNCPDVQRLEWRVGDAAQEIGDLCVSAAPDLIVLSFAGTLDTSRGEVIRELLRRASSPMLVMPVRRSPADSVVYSGPAVRS